MAPCAMHTNNKWLIAPLSTFFWKEIYLTNFEQGDRVSRLPYRMPFQHRRLALGKWHQDAQVADRTHVKWNYIKCMRLICLPASRTIPD
jgi:hypothetical protein